MADIAPMLQCGDNLPPRAVARFRARRALHIVSGERGF